MCCKNIFGIVLEVKDADEARIGNFLDLSIRSDAHLIKGHVKLAIEDWIVKEGQPFSSFLWLIVQDDRFEIIGGIRIESAKRCNCRINLLSRRHHFKTNKPSHGV